MYETIINQAKDAILAENRDLSLDVKISLIDETMQELGRNLANKSEYFEDMLRNHGEDLFTLVGYGMAKAELYQSEDAYSQGQLTQLFGIDTLEGIADAPHAGIDTYDLFESMLSKNEAVRAIQLRGLYEAILDRKVDQDSRKGLREYRKSLCDEHNIIELMIDQYDEIGNVPYMLNPKEGIRGRYGEIPNELAQVNKKLAEMKEEAPEIDSVSDIVSERANIPIYEIQDRREKPSDIVVVRRNPLIIRRREDVA